MKQSGKKGGIGSNGAGTSNRIYWLLVLVSMLFVLDGYSQNSGFGTVSPTHPLHVTTSSGDPVRFENLQAGAPATESAMLVVDPATGILRYIEIEDLNDILNQSPWFSTLTDAPAISNTDDIYINGKVGVLVDNPQYDLQVNKRIHVGDNLNYVSINDREESETQRLGNLSGEGFIQAPWVYASAVEAPGEKGGSSTLVVLGHDGDFHSSPDKISLVTDGTQRLFVDDNGEVGIGTTTPDARLDIEGGTVRFSDYGNNAITGTPTSILGVEADGDLVEISTSSLSENIYNTNGTLTASRAVTQGNFDLNFDANTFVISGDDNRIGLGTSDPIASLHVVLPGNRAALGQHAAVFEGDNSLPSTNEGVIVGFKTSLSDDEKNVNVGIGSERKEFTAAVSTFHIMLREDDDNVTFADSKVAVLANGMVGIGTTSPDARLDVEGGTVRFTDYGNNAITGTATSILGVEADGDLVEVSTSSLSENIYNTDGTLTGNRAVTQGNFDLNFDANTFVISGDDNRVGVNVQDPTVAIDVNGGGLFRNGGFTSGPLLEQIGFASENSNLFRHSIRSRHNFFHALGNSIDFYLWDAGVDGLSTSGSQHVMSIEGFDGGRVGIGTTTPSTMLDVAGQTRTEDFTMTSGAANGRLLQSDATGNASWVAPSTLFTDTDNQSIRNLSFSGTTLTVGIEDGSSQSVSLGTLSDNQSIRNLGLSGTTLTVGIEDGSSQTVSLAGLRDNLGDHRLTQNLQTRGSWISTFGGAEGIFVEAGGNVGIGTASPNARFDVEGGRVRFSDYGSNAITGTATSILGVEADGDVVEVNTSTLSENIYNTNGTLTGDRAVAQNNFDLNFDANTFVISGDDNRVGIGTASPEALLDVGGNGLFRNGNTFRAFANNQIQFGLAGSSNYKHSIKTRHNSADAFGNAIDFYLWDSGVDAISASGTQQVLTLDALDGGRVGVGTVSPNAKLDVEDGNLEFSGSYGLDWANDPWGGGGDNAWMKWVQDGTGENTELQIGVSNGPDDNISFYQNGAERMTIFNGNVGIGTDFPLVKLHVNGAVRVETLPIGVNTDQIVTTDSDGNLRKVNGLKAAKTFYPPSIAVDVSTNGTGRTVDLYAEYIDQYGSPAVVSAGAPSAIPTYAATELYYYVSYADPAVFDNMSIDAVGIFTYDVIGQPFDQNALINVVFVVK